MTTERRVAGLGRRLGARLLDALVVAPLLAVAEVLALTAEGGPREAVALLLLVLSAGLGLYNQVVRTGRRGQSFGRQLLQLRVVDQDTGEPIGAGRAFGRELLLGLLAGLCLLPAVASLVAAARDARRQGWHDRAAGTVVVAAEGPHHVQPEGSRPVTPRTTSSPPTADTPGPRYRPAAPPGPPAGPPAMVPPPPGMVPPPPAGPDAGEAPQRTVPRAAVPAAAPGGTAWTLTTRAGDSRTVGGLLVLGRDPAPGLVAGATSWALDDPGLTVSKTHALVGLDGGEPWVEDWHSTNGVVVSREHEVLRCAPHVRTPVRSGDVIWLGDFEVRVASRP